MRLLDKRIMSHFDYLILIFIAPLIILSYVLISEANDALASKQVFYYTISLFIFILVFMFPLRKNLRLVPFLYWIGILLLLAVEFIGVTFEPCIKIIKSFGLLSLLVASIKLTIRFFFLISLCKYVIESISNFSINFWEKEKTEKRNKNKLKTL
jgi:hypothetical protein